MENEDMNEQNRQDNGMDDAMPDAAGYDGAPEETDVADNSGSESGQKTAVDMKPTDSPRVQKLLDELTAGSPDGDDEEESEDGPEGLAEPDLEDPSADVEKKQVRTAEEEELELLKTVKSERGRERIKSIIAARREAEARLEQKTSSLNEFQHLLRSTRLDPADLARTMEYGRLVSVGDPESLRSALNMLDEQREAICRKLGINAPGVDLFSDVPAIKESLERQELKMEDALKLAALERADRWRQVAVEEEQERDARLEEVFSHMGDFMKNAGAYFRQYEGGMDHQYKMQKLFDLLNDENWAMEFVSKVPHDMWFDHLKFLYDNVQAPDVRPAVTAQPLRSSPVASAPVADNPNLSSAERIMRRIDELGI